MKLRLTSFLSVFVGLAALASSVSAQTFPSQAVRIISPFPTGSGPDVIARIVGERLSSTWKQPVIIDAKPGANGFIAAGAVKQAAPTGYDLLIADVGHLAISPSLFRKMPYDPKTDFVPVGGVYRTSFFVVVGANSPYNSVKDLVAAAAAAPGKITYGSNSVGGPLHLGAAQVEAVTSTKMTHVPYKEISQLYVAVATGEVDWAMGSLASAGPLLKAGKVKLIAIADNARSTIQPGVPTIEEALGGKSVIARTWVVLMAPKATTAATIGILNKSLNEALKLSDVAEKFANFGFVPYPTTPALLAALIDTDTLFYSEMVKRTGATAE